MVELTFPWPLLTSTRVLRDLLQAHTLAILTGIGQCTKKREINWKSHGQLSLLSPIAYFAPILAWVGRCEFVVYLYGPHSCGLSTVWFFLLQHRFLLFLLVSSYVGQASFELLILLPLSWVLTSQAYTTTSHFLRSSQMQAQFLTKTWRCGITLEAARCLRVTYWKKCYTSGFCVAPF